MLLRRIIWLVRRLSRIYPAEIPFRIAGAATAVLRRTGLGSADKVPQVNWNGCKESAWVSVPRDAVTADAIGVADDILTDKVEVFGRPVILVDGCPRWNVDPLNGIPLPMTFGLFIDFRHLAHSIDIKFLWELNRHLWLVPLAQAFALTSEEKYLIKLGRLLQSWLDECPYPLGANWSSPVEHGIRLINWSIIWHLIGGKQSRLFNGNAGQQLLDKWLKSIYQHIHFARDNYSFYSSADNHLIGEAAGVFVGAKTWNLWPVAASWAKEARGILETEVLKQFSDDGVNREQAICYHKFSLEFLLAAGLAARAAGEDFSDPYWRRISKAVEFLTVMADCQWRLPNIGDADDGKVFCLDPSKDFNPYRSIVALSGLILDDAYFASKAGGIDDQTRWLVASNQIRATPPSALNPYPTQPQFIEGGYVVAGRNLHKADEWRLIMDVGALGFNRIAGHGHADALSVLVSYAGRAFLVDSGTYCYNTDPSYRRYFRGTSAHNCVMIDGLDQAEYGGSFLWLHDVNSRVHELTDDGRCMIVLASHDGYMRLKDPVRHYRRLTMNRDLLEAKVEDWVECKHGHSGNLFWHLAPDCFLDKSDVGWIAQNSTGRLEISIDAPTFSAEVLCGEESPPMGWYSRHFYDKQKTNVIVASGALAPSKVVTTQLRIFPTATGHDLAERTN
jgi:hypothetical protein